jgi:hypothetical protein
MPDRIDATVERMEEALLDEVIDDVPADPGGEQLPTSHDALLAGGKDGAQAHRASDAKVKTI